MSCEGRDCYNCDCWDSDREGCTMPSVDHSHACPLEDDEIYDENLEGV